MKIGIGNDHVAVDMKNEIKEYLESKGYEVVNFGTDSKERCNYPVYGEAVANAVVSGEPQVNVGSFNTYTNIFSITFFKDSSAEKAVMYSNPTYPSYPLSASS